MVERYEFILIGTAIMLLGIVGFVLNMDKFFQFWLYNKTNTISVCGAVTNMALIILAFPLIITSYMSNSWLWGDVGCSMYGFLTLFLGFIQMYVPIMAIYDAYLENTDPEYDLYVDRKRRKMIIFSVLCSLFWGAAPLVGWSQMGYEPTGLSCSIYEYTPGFGYLSYMIINVTFYEIVPFIIVIYCIINSVKSSIEDPRILKLVLLSVSLVISWTPYTIVYFWPLFDDPKNMPMRLSAWAPFFAKIAVITIPSIVDM